MAKPAQSKATRRDFLKFAAAGAGVATGPWVSRNAQAKPVSITFARESSYVKNFDEHFQKVMAPAYEKATGIKIEYQIQAAGGSAPVPAGLDGREQGRCRPGLGPAGVALPRRAGGRVRHRGGGGQAAGRLVRRDQGPVRRQGQVEVHPQREHRPAYGLPEGLVRRGRGQEVPRDLGRIHGGRHQAQGQGPSVRHVHGPRLRRQLFLALPPAVVLRGHGHGQGLARRSPSTPTRPRRPWNT